MRCGWKKLETGLFYDATAPLEEPSKYCRCGPTR
jgi:hypothetical protein